MKKSIKRLKIFLLLPILIIGVFLGQTNFAVHVDGAANAYTYDNCNAIISAYITNATNGTAQIVESYNLADEYPIWQEDQQNSDFCWIYASLKALESSYMKQKNEYYNFSEMATAVFSYKLRNYSSDFKNMSGNFDYFINAVSEYGLVHESDFQTDYVNDITHSNYQNYMFVKDLSDKSLIDNVKVYNIASNANFANASKANKASVLKQFISNYGGIYVSVNGGYLYADGGAYFTKSASEAQSHAEYYQIGGHALCLVGWDADGFLALNSWGYESESRYPLVHISENEDCMYNFIYGFDVGTFDVQVTDSSATKFKNKLKSASTNLNNYFCYNENLSITYSILKSKHSNVYLKIFKGEEDVTNKFQISKTQTETDVQLTLSGSQLDGGYYLLRFYDTQNKLITTKAIYIYSGNEFAYFKFANQTSKNEVPPVYDSYVFANSFLSSDRAVTIVTNTLRECEFQFKMNPFCTNSTLNPLRFELGQVYVSVVSGGNQTFELAANLSLGKIQDNQENVYVIKINNLNSSVGSEYIGEHLYFTVRVYSTEYANVYNEYYFNIIYSSNSTYESGKLFNVIYHTDGAKNNPTNLEKYTSDFNNNEPIGVLQTKDSGAKFIAWFQDNNFSSQIETISGSLNKNLQLFALFENDNDVTYLDSSLSLDQVYNENNVTVANDLLIYGYKEKFKFDFGVTERLLDLNQPYTASYDVYVTHGGVRTKQIFLSSEIMTEPKTVYFTIQNLNAGNSTIEVVLTVSVSSNFTVTKSYTSVVFVQKRLLSVSATNAEIDYDGQNHVLNTSSSAKFEIDTNSILPADRLLFEATVADDFGSKIAKNAGTYTYKIRSVNNQNYTFDSSISATLIINKLPLTVVWGELTTTYNGQENAPTFTLYEGDEISQVTASTNYSSYKNAGNYNVKIDESTLSNQNYKIANNEAVKYQILPATIIIHVEDQTDRVQTVFWNRKAISWRITNSVFDSEQSLLIHADSEALTTESYGAYPIYVTAGNSNYVVEQNLATYTLTGYYKITYILPDGETYEENVEEGNVPMGVPKEKCGLGFFEGYTYSRSLSSINDDVSVRVTIQDYKVYAIGGGVFVLFLVIYFAMAKSSKRKKYS